MWEEKDIRNYMGWSTQHSWKMMESDAFQRITVDNALKTVSEIVIETVSLVQ